MPDAIQINIKGGGIRPVKYDASCNLDCSACSTDLPKMPRKVSWHDGTALPFLWSTFDPQHSFLDKTCTAADEVITAPAIIGQVPANYTMHRIAVPPHSILQGLGVTHTLPVDPYNQMSDTFAGLVYDVTAHEVDYSTCPNAIGADVTATVVPAVLAGLVAATAGTIVAPVAPALGGYVTGDKGLLLSLKITTPPTVGLSNLQGSITLQANVQTFNSLIR